MKRSPLALLSLISALALVLVLLAACVEESTVELDCHDGAEQWVEYRLFMGRSDGDREVVSDADWEAFLADIITPRFPDGLSVIDVAGQSTTQDGAVEQERSKMLLIFSPPGDNATDRMDEIGSEYKQRFNQNSVLRIVTDACVAIK